MKKNLFTVYLVCLSPLFGYAQFNEAIGTYKTQFGHSVQTTQVDPGFVVAGKDNHIVFGASEASVVKTKPDGSVVWSSVYGGTRDDWFNSVREITAVSSPNAVQGYAALGKSASFTGTSDFYFVKTDLTGNALYSLIFGRGGEDEGRCLQYIKDYATGRYGYVMVGQTNSYPYYGYTTDILVVKIDEFGNYTGATVMGGSGEDVAYWIEQTSDGGFIIAGSTTSRTCAATVDNKDIFVIRLDQNLKILWNTIIGHKTDPAHDIAYGVVQDPIDRSFTVTGIARSFGASAKGDAFLLNLDPAGGLNWMKTYGTTNLEQGNSITYNRTTWGDIEYVVAGSAYGDGANEDAYVFKTDRFGNLKWTFLYGTLGGTERASEITNSELGGYVFTGSARASFANDTDKYLVKTTYYGKSDSNCQRELPQEEKPQWPCLHSSLQQVFVNDLKRVYSYYKRVDYQVKRCEVYESFALLGSMDQPAHDELTTPNASEQSIDAIIKNVAAEGSTLMIYNRNGKIVYEGAVTEDEPDQSIGTLPSDLYIIRVTTRNGKQFYKKFFKK